MDSYAVEFGHRYALRGLSPPVWRRVLIPETMTLGQFHEALQMGVTSEFGIHCPLAQGDRLPARLCG
ncbi:IS1096 element passenger TnpR family protein [Cupriavidus metallidurans]|uniref:IS1096 element passenger TnpR family protein n=1 Tax=Cupriavidus metallidurans TaxID=119219 RepID=UPI003D722D77